MMQKMAMPKKIENDRTYIEAGLNALIRMKQPGESHRDVFTKVMGREPESQSELNTFSNRLKIYRGNPGLDFIGKFASAYPELRNMTVGQLLGIDE
ncbi:hypothetical protein AUR67_00510 [Pseudoalteromonas sp. XI10]|uniref:hypothetical protein n=1 Tax=Pseudoalteromonas sp. XI10 TaxID=1766621 RepID=UPI0007338254|nr:hypothetical protein [Pseudoalteromonas sp. XI10]KTG21994.1 hypothetical protein AUR67_00510 [Pseudoalteromonas sp. XI10]